MILPVLEGAVREIKTTMELAITSARFGGRSYSSGHAAKTALIRSSRLINRIHEVVKVSLDSALKARNADFVVHPPIGQSGPELCISGLLKAKMQDVVALPNAFPPLSEIIADGPLAGSIDQVGFQASNRAIVVGIRSQLSSVAKNFDTLMERAFAETLNLRLRLPRLVMGEVYLLPVVEYDDQAMKENRVAWSRRSVPIRKFISTFAAISGRSPDASDEDHYKYERSALVLVDLRPEDPIIFRSRDELICAGLLDQAEDVDFSALSPQDFAKDLVNSYLLRFA